MNLNNKAIFNEYFTRVNDMRNQKEQVLEYLKAGRGITSWEAIQMFRATRLSAIIFELKNEGYQFITKRIIHNGKNYVEYKLFNKNSGTDLFGNPIQLSEIDLEIEKAINQL